VSRKTTRPKNESGRILDVLSPYLHQSTLIISNILLLINCERWSWSDFLTGNRKSICSSDIFSFFKGSVKLVRQAVQAFPQWIALMEVYKYFDITTGYTYKVRYEAEATDYWPTINHNFLHFLKGPQLLKMGVPINITELLDAYRVLISFWLRWIVKKDAEGLKKQSNKC